MSVPLLQHGGICYNGWSSKSNVAYQVVGIVS